MKNLLTFTLVINFVLLLTSCDKKEVKKELTTFHYSISLDIANLRGPVILLDRTTKEPIKTVYSRTPEFKIEGELPLEKMHASFILHFPSKYSNPYMYPVAKACAIDFYMDNNTIIKAHYDSLLFSNVENKHMNAVKAFKSNNFPAIIAFEAFNRKGLLENGTRRGKKEQLAYANKGNVLLDVVRKEIIKKVGEYMNSEEMTVVLAKWGGQLSLKTFDSITSKLDQSVHNTAAYKRVIAVSDYIKEQKTPASLKVGQTAPEFSLKDIEGNLHFLSDFKGKYLIIDFWASWCGPCKREMPFMKELYNKYNSKGLEMLAISTDKDVDAWKKAMKKLNMPYLQLHDKNSKVANSYFVRGIPYVLFIDPKGDIIAIERGKALEETIKKHLKL